jgi:hypothetical protein
VSLRMPQTQSPDTAQGIPAQEPRSASLATVGFPDRFFAEPVGKPYGSTHIGLPRRSRLWRFLFQATFDRRMRS